MEKLFIAISVILALSIFLAAGCSNSKNKNNPVGGDYDEAVMKALVNPPVKINFFLRTMIKIADKKAEREMMLGRVLSWSSKIAVSSGLLELFVEEGAASILDTRLMKILRIKISYMVHSPFAIDINSWNYQNFEITEEEMRALQGKKDIEKSGSFSEREKVALKYSTALTATPVVLNRALLNDMRRLFSEQEIVAIAALTAKVNYWARVSEALRIKSAGYTDDPVLEIDKYNSLKK